MHTLTFFNLGNAETLLIKLNNGKRLIFDYADMKDHENPLDLRCNLPDELRAEFARTESNEVDVLAFTHLDRDHVNGASDFFWLNWAIKYQSDSRIRIKELWVPALAILESDREDDARAIRQEARHRLVNENGVGIRVFSAPDMLVEWFENNGLDIEDYRERGVLVDAGTLAPGFNLESEECEMFIHSPFSSPNTSGGFDRNDNCLAMQIVFAVGNERWKLFVTGDLPAEPLALVSAVTRHNGNEHRLEWNIIDIPHHTSYLSLNTIGNKGSTKTEPLEGVKFLYQQGQKGGLLVTSSDPIPNKDTDQPPHHQAAAYYKDVAANIGGSFHVAMEHPNRFKPRPLVIEIGPSGPAVKVSYAAVLDEEIVSRPAPRVG